MGVVYEADRADGMRVALKFLLPAIGVRDPRRERRFHDEIVAGSIVRHPGVVTIIDHGERPEDNTPFLVMEYVRGERLSCLIRRGQIDLVTAIDLGCQLLRALQALHDAGIVHGDVKSDNILVEQRADGAHALTLIDFGLAKVWLDDSSPEKMDMISGTPDYMAPEVIRGCGGSPASDIYGAAVLLYEMLVGSTPFGGGSARDILARHLDDEVVPPSLRDPEAAVPAALDLLVLRGLAKTPRERPSSAASFANQLSTILATSPRAGVPRRCVRLSEDAPTVPIHQPSVIRRMPQGTPQFARFEDDRDACEGSPTNIAALRKCG